jgi:MoaA/NifB/PqqE/SkfB family radical SAM enzyme
MELVYSGDKTFLREPDQINIVWRLLRLCNYNCWYCYEYDNKRKILPYNDALKIVEFLSKIDKKFIRLNITGGEPTLYPRFLDLIAMIIAFISSDSKLRLTLWTNLSANVQLYKEFYSFCCRFSNVEPVIVPGFHKGFTDIEDFKNKWDALRNFGIDKMVFTVFEDECFEDIEKVRDYPYIVRAVKGKEEVMDNKDIDFGFFHYYVEPVSVFYDGEYVYSDTLETKEFPNYVCKAYEYNLYIDDDAKAYACPRSIRHVKTKSYNLLDEKETEMLLRRDAIVCPLPDCVCEWFIPKFSMRGYHRLKDTMSLEFLESLRKVDKKGIDLREGIGT